MQFRIQLNSDLIKNQFSCLLPDITLLHVYLGLLNNSPRLVFNHNNTEQVTTFAREASRRKNQKNGIEPQQWYTPMN